LPGCGEELFEGYLRTCYL